MSLASPELAMLAVAGIVAGLVLLVRGFGGHRDAARIGDTATSRIATMAIGEVRVTGVVEPAELSLVSPLQSVPSVYYRASTSRSSDDGTDTVFHEERSVGFRIRDDSGSVRVFPRGARFEVPDVFSESTGTFGEAPVGLNRRSGGAFAVAEPSREDQIAALLTVRQPVAAEPSGGDGTFLAGTIQIGTSRSRTRYREARLEPGDTVTVLGRVLPFDQLPDPTGADVGGDGLDPLAALRDPETAASIAEARAAGELAATPEEAWGNAAIPGFGIGRPVRAPELDPAASAAPLATAEEAARAERTFEIEPHDLVIAASADAPLTVALGPPDVAAARHEDRFLLGLLGAVIAIGSAVALAILLGGGLPA